MDDVRFAAVEDELRELRRQGDRHERRIEALAAELERSTKNDYQLLLAEVQKERRHTEFHEREGGRVLLSDLKRHQAERLAEHAARRAMAEGGETKPGEPVQ